MYCLSIACSSCDSGSESSDENGERGIESIDFHNRHEYGSERLGRAATRTADNNGSGSESASVNGNAADEERWDWPSKSHRKKKKCHSEFCDQASRKNSAMSWESIATKDYLGWVSRVLFFHQFNSLCHKRLYHIKIDCDATLFLVLFFIATQRVNGFIISVFVIFSWKTGYIVSRIIYCYIHRVIDTMSYKK